MDQRYRFRFVFTNGDTLTVEGPLLRDTEQSVSIGESDSFTDVQYAGVQYVDVEAL